MSECLSKKRPDNPLISLVVPVLNEEKALASFFSGVNKVLGSLRLEIIFIDDGSYDQTFSYLQAYAEHDPRLVLIKLSRNFGKEAALTAGLDYAKGDVVIPVDVDLQDPIDVILQFLEKWRAGYDVVHGVRADRSEDSYTKRTSAHVFYKVFNHISDIRMSPHAGDFRLLDRSVVLALRTLPERVRFMKGLFSWVGFSSAEVKYQRCARQTGDSKFGIVRLFRFACDGIFSFSSLPLRIWSFVGTLIAVPSLLFMVFIVVKTLLLGRDVPGYASLASIILFIGGIQLISLGFIGEYVGRIFTEVKQRPPYIIETLKMPDAS